MIGRRSLLAALALGAPAAARADEAGDALPKDPDRAVQSAWFPALIKEARYGPTLGTLDRLGPVASDLAGQAWALLGDEPKALDAWRRRGVAKTPDAAAVVRARGEMTRLSDAVEAIATAAAGNRVVILNEDHNRSRHRAFTGLVLARLRRDGFDLFAAEAFAPPPLPTLGEPVTSRLGLYTADPVFAETVREALAAGYRLASYEQRPEQKPAPGETGLAPRERFQAENLMAALRANPASRVVVHSGEGHGMRTEFGPGVASFGLALNRMLDEPALVVDQLKNCAMAAPELDSPLLQAAAAHGIGRRPDIALDALGRPMTGGLGAMVDLAVISPRLPDQRGRPGWLMDRPGRKAVRVTLPKNAPRGLVQALPAGELAASPLTIPADQLPTAAGVREVVLSLRPGRYRLRLETADARSDLGVLTV